LLLFHLHCQERAMSGSLKGAIEQGLVKAIGKMKNAPSESQFLTAGTLTPAEFIEAGDLLVYKCPAWQWAAGDPKRAVPYLPADKQCLVTRKAPCSVRASALEASAGLSTYRAVEVDGDDGWVCEDGGGDGVQEAVEEVHSASDVDSDADIPDMEQYDEENIVDAGAIRGTDHLVAQRTYDISITYDNYYNTPRMWLFGYNENGRPLETKDVFADISEDHARKTVTVDAHPHWPTQTWAYIHPCKVSVYCVLCCCCVARVYCVAHVFYSIPRLWLRFLHA
jgi:ubiquitin-like-conjugating enzyme ATG3